MNLKTALFASAASVALTVSSVASADGYYVGVFGGWSTFDDDISTSFSYSYFGTTTTTTTHNNFLSVTASANATDDFEDGWVVGAALGTSLGEGLRGELELAFRTFDVDAGFNINANAYGAVGTSTTGGTYVSTTTSLSTRIAASSDGDMDVWSVMANIWYDFNMGDSAYTPFVGVGVGMANLSLDYSATVAGTFTNTASSTTFAFSTGTSFSDDAWAFAYQFGAGLAYNMGNGSTLSAQYRYFGTTDAEFGPLEVRAESHAVMVGFNFPMQ